MGWPVTASRGWLAIAAGIGTALAVPLLATCYWDIRCRGADDACALGYLIWLMRSLLCGPLIGTGVATLLSPGDRRPLVAFVTLGVSATPLWTLLGYGHFQWGW
jgi:hypothetical protein